MNIYLGTDLVYIPRIKIALDRFGERFLRRVYTSVEQQDCYQRDANGLRRDITVAQLAGRWAAKEAVAKALGTGWRGIRYTDIEIRRQPSGAPKIHLYRSAAALAAGLGEGNWQLSLSHDGDYATATAILYYS